MVAYSFVQRLTPHVALAGAGAVGLIFALGTLLAPSAAFENSVLTSGIAAFVPAAEPPLGLTARLCVALLFGGSAALLAWVGLTWLPSVMQLRLGTNRAGPVVRRADAHPDAPPREPLRAGRDLGYESPEALDDDLAAFDLGEPDLPPEPVIARGAPTPAVEPEPIGIAPETPAAPPPVQPLPTDLDQPLAAFDPAALPDAPLPAPRPVAPLLRQAAAPVFEAGERFETFDLSPPAIHAAVSATAPITGPETVATVHTLLDRLERGIARRTQPEAPASEPAPQGLETTLDKLRRMAARG